jgi:hypothetical protein
MRTQLLSPLPLAGEGQGGGCSLLKAAQPPSSYVHVCKTGVQIFFTRDGSAWGWER